MSYWTESLDKDNNIKDCIICPHCGSIINKTQNTIAKETVVSINGDVAIVPKKRPVLICYKYNGKKIQYKITVISIKNADFDIKQNGVLQVKVNPSENKYDVNNQKLLETTRNPKATGCLDPNTGNIYVRNDCSFYTPNSTNPSTTGAHEIGHMLGMSHKDEGIMTEKLNDPKRNNDVLQSNINEMMQSSFGHHDIISKILMQIGKSEKLVTNFIVGNLSLKTISIFTKKISFKK